MSLATKWERAFPLHENHPEFTQEENLSTQSTQPQGPFFYIIVNQGVLRFSKPLGVGSQIDVDYTYVPSDLTITGSTGNSPDLPSAYQEAILDIATRNMFSTPGDDTRFQEWAAVAQNSIQGMMTDLQYRRQNQAQRENRRQRWAVGPDGRATMVLDHLEGPTQPPTGVKTT